MNVPIPQGKTSLLEEIRTLQAIGDWAQAASLLANTMETLLDCCAPTAIEEIVARFPPMRFD